MRITQLLIYLLISASGFSQIEIVEYSASNLSDIPDKFERYEDWIKIQNTSDGDVLLNGWHLSDKEDKPFKFELPLDVTLAPQEKLIVFCSGRDLMQEGEIHTNFKLSQTTGKDRIVLTNPQGEIVFNRETEITLLGHSRILYNQVWQIHTEPTEFMSVDQSNVFSQYTEKPTISLEAGFYDGPQSIEIENNHPNSTLHYTLDGSDVSSASPIYDGPINLSSTKHIKAKAFPFDSSELPGQEAFATIIIDENFSLPVFSVGAALAQDLANGDGWLIPIGSVEYFNETGELESASYGEMNRHGKDSWNNPHRSLDFICRDEMGYSKHIEGKLFSTSEREEFQRLMFRASGDDNYPAQIESSVHDGATHIRDEFVQTLAVEGDLQLDCRKVQRVILFLNGDYWGVYALREKVADHDFTKEYYDQGKYDIEFLSHWGGTVPTYGEKALENWSLIRDFILESDMSIDSNYQRVKDEIDVISLIDYFLVNLNVVAADWLDWNTGWWRGNNPEGEHKKWGYILWDMDATFDYYINYTGIPNTDFDAVPCSLEEISASLSWGEHEDIILKLIDENPGFRLLYFQRYSDLANSAFSCENMLNTLDRMTEVIRPEMPRQIERWGGTLEEWNENIIILRQYVEDRCAYLNIGAIDCYDELETTHNVILQTEPSNIGEIDFNMLDIEIFPWSGDYFGNIPNEIKAKVFDEYEEAYEFSHWKSTSGNLISPSITERRAEYTMTTSDTLVAVFKSIAVNTEEVHTDLDITVFPVPMSENMPLFVQINEPNYNDCMIHVYSLGGKLIKAEKGKTGTNQIDLSNINKGIYFLEISKDGLASLTHKIILQ